MVEGSKVFQHECPGELPKILKSSGDKYVVTTGQFNNMRSGICVGGKVIELSNDMLKCAMFYFSTKTTLEVKQFLNKTKYIILVEYRLTSRLMGTLIYVKQLLIFAVLHFVFQ